MKAKTKQLMNYLDKNIAGDKKKFRNAVREYNCELSKAWVAPGQAVDLKKLEALEREQLNKAELSEVLIFLILWAVCGLGAILMVVGVL